MRGLSPDFAKAFARCATLRPFGLQGRCLTISNGYSFSTMPIHRSVPAAMRAKSSGVFLPHRLASSRLELLTQLCIVQPAQGIELGAVLQARGDGSERATSTTPGPGGVAGVGLSVVTPSARTVKRAGSDIRSASFST